MSLRTYQWPRLVILRSSASALEAARALENNHVGAVLVQDRGGVAGIVTDRDLAMRVTSRGLDPREVSLGEVMTRDVAVLPIEATRTEALLLMQARRIRRIPLVEADRVVGVVTFDDLLADEAAPLPMLADVVRAQIGEGGPAAETRLELEAASRRASRLEASYRRLVNEFRSEAALPGIREADTALMIVLSALVRRLTPDEAKDLIAQLPLKIGERLAELPAGPDKAITSEGIKNELVNRLSVTPLRAGEILEAVARTLDGHVSAGEMRDVRHQLPKELRNELLPQLAEA